MIATVTAAGGGASIHAPMSGSLTKSCDEAVHAATCPTGSTGRRRFYCAIGLLVMIASRSALEATRNALYKSTATTTTTTLLPVAKTVDRGLRSLPPL